MEKVNVFKTKAKEFEILSNILNELYDQKDKVFKSYSKVGEEQKKDWRTGELCWEDEEHTIPEMRDIYDYVTRSEDDITDSDREKFAAIAAVIKYIESYK